MRYAAKALLSGLCNFDDLVLSYDEHAGVTLAPRFSNTGG